MKWGLGDPAYVGSLLVVLAAIAGITRTLGSSLKTGKKIALFIALLLLCLLSGCYAWLGTSCYVFGGCP